MRIHFFVLKLLDGQPRQQTSGFEIRPGHGGPDEHAGDDVTGHGGHVQRRGNRYGRRYDKVGSDGRPIRQKRRYGQIRG